MHTFFIAGTDTGVGKTRVAVALVEALKKQGRTVAAQKPVAAGCELLDGHWVNDDALALMRAANAGQDYAQVNPVALKGALAPHIAAAREDRQLSVAGLEKVCARKVPGADTLIVEGAGGWLVPLNDRETLADLVSARQWPVILVVGMRLGCLNHALLSVEAIRSRGVQLAGWIANQIDPEMIAYEENLDTLRRGLPAPLLGEMVFGGDLELTATGLSAVTD